MVRLGVFNGNIFGFVVPVMQNREKRIGLMGDKPFGAGYMRQIERKAKEMEQAIKRVLAPKRQKGLPGF